MNAPSTRSERRRWWPFVVAFGAFLAIMHFSRAPNVPPVRCDADVDPDYVDVVMLSAVWCGYCAQARRYFVDGGVNYCEYDIELTDTGRALYERSGIRAIPVIMIDDELIVGFDKHEIEQSLAANDLLDLDRL